MCFAIAGRLRGRNRKKYWKRGRNLGLGKYAPARELIDAGAIVSLATDYNPGTSPTLSMPMILSLACTRLRMRPSEAIAAATINAAYGLRREKSIGSLE